MHLFPTIPHTTFPFCHGQQFLSHAGCEPTVATLARAVDDPLDGGATTLSLRERNRDLHGGTTTGNTLLVADLDQRGNGVHDESKIENGVERKLRTGRAGKERTFGVGLGRGRDA